MSYVFYERNEKQVNFGDLTGNLISAVSGIEEKRQKKRDALEKQYNDFKGVVDGWENVKTQNINELVHRANDDIRNQMYESYQKLKAGEISETEYKAMMNNANSTWNAMSASAKAYDKTIQEMLSRQQPGENGEPPKGGAVEQAWLDAYSELSDLSNKRYMMGSDGNIVLATMGEDGKPVSIMSANAINKMGVIQANRVDLNESSSKYTKEVENWLLTNKKPDGTSYTIEDARQNPAFEKYMMDIENAIAGDHNPLAQASVLLDNGGDYRTYRTQAEKKQIIDEMTEREAQAVFNSTGKPMTDEEKAKYRADYEDKMIAIEMQKDGQLMPVLTDSQKKESKKIARAAVEMRLGRKETTDAEKTYHAPRTPRPAAKKEDKFAGWATYGTLSAAWLAGDSQSLNAMNPEYEFEFKPGGGKVVIYKKLKEPRQVPSGVGTGTVTQDKEKIATVTDARNLAAYAYGTGTDDKGVQKAYQAYDSQKERYMNDPSVDEEDKKARGWKGSTKGGSTKPKNSGGAAGDEVFLKKNKT